MNARFLAIAQDPSIIHGVHHYCDEWCTYCTVTDRCLGFRCTEAFRQQRGRRHGDATFASLEEAVGFTRELAVLDGSRTEELDAILAHPSGGSGLATTDPLASLAWEYAVDAAFQFTERAIALISERRRPGGPLAEEVVLWYHLRIYMKVVRALVSRERAGGDDRLLESAAGCARLALVSIDRSAAALESLRTAANAEPIDRLLTALEALRRGLEERVPQARAFVRYGLDCPVA